jgi:sugar phosphate isomerase/epimerase
MRLSTATSGLAKLLGFEGTFQAMKAAGFEAYDFSASTINRKEDSPLMGDHYMEFLTEIKNIADSLGLVCNQAHATFPPEKYGDEEYNKRAYKQILREMECASILGAKRIVVHAVKPLPKGMDSWGINLKFYRGLIPYCEKYNIQVAVENLFEPDEKRGRRRPCFIGTSEKLAKFIDELDSPWFTVCFDVGHAAINGEDPEDAIRNLGKRIGCVHLHDNNWVDDQHLVPYLGKTDWNEVCKAFADIDYQGDFTLETVHFEDKFPAEVLPDAVLFEAKLARHLMKKIEDARNA